MAKRLVNGVWVEEPDNEETKATEPSVQETEVDANVEEGSQQDSGEGTTGGWVLPQFRLENFGLDNTDLLDKKNLSPIQGENAIENAERLGVVPTMEQVKENAAKAEEAQAQEGLSELERKAEESQRLADDAFANYVSMLNQQAEEAKPQYTEEELQRYSRANTGFASMLSAIANVANVGNVAKGGYAAVVPDGYKVAKAQWDQIKKDERARKRYYDQLKAQIADYGYKKLKADADRDLASLTAAQKQAYELAKIEAKSKAEMEQKLVLAGVEVEKARAIAEINFGFDTQKQSQKHKDAMDEIGKRGSEDRSTARTKSEIKIKEHDLGISGSDHSGSDKNIEELRSKTYRGTKYTVPNGTDITEAYSNKVYPFLIDKINKKIEAISTYGSDDFITDLDKRNSKIESLSKKIDELNAIGYGSDNDSKYKAVDKMSQYLGELEVTEDEWNGLFSESGSGDATDRLAN